jgi:hypothetical protein
MDTNRLNRWLTLGANFGVLFGIILLIVELDQNRDMIRAQTRNDISQQITEFLSQIANNSELSNIKRRAEAGRFYSNADDWSFYLSFVMCPHAQYLYHVFFSQDLVDQPVLNIDSSGIGSF